MKIKIRPTDTLFSKIVRTRDDWTCQRCGHKYEPNCGASLHCSHYYSRGKENTRFDLDNCIALCYGCHRLWGHGDDKDEYTAYMIRKLTPTGFANLKLRSNLYKQRDDKLDMLYLKTIAQKYNIKL